MPRCRRNYKGYPSTQRPPENKIDFGIVGSSENTSTFGIAESTENKKERRSTKRKGSLQITFGNGFATSIHKAFRVTVPEFTFTTNLVKVSLPGDLQQLTFEKGYQPELGQCNAAHPLRSKSSNAWLPTPVPRIIVCMATDPGANIRRKPARSGSSDGLAERLATTHF